MQILGVKPEEIPGGLREGPRSLIRPKPNAAYAMR